jgi:branched-subunit amino acid aminotransferase/4-amino-4-deoxychorismate lyase
MLVWLNGQFVDRDAARISVFDAGLLHAVGLFETMMAANGRMFRGGRHLARLVESAQQLHLTERLHPEPLRQVLQTVLEHNDLERARVRLTITGGDLNLLQTDRRGPVDPTILVVAQPPTHYPDTLFTEGVTVVIADARTNPLEPTAGHKTLNYWSRIQALQTAAARHASEALWFTVSNHLSGGSVSNVFLVRDGGLVTPIARGEEQAGGLPSPVLPGITRSTIVELAESDDLPVDRRMLDIDDLLSAEEVFLTNSSWGVLPVVRVERESIGDGGVGDVTRRLREAWLALVEEETAADPETDA